MKKPENQTSRILRSEEAATYEPWQPPTMGTGTRLKDQDKDSAPLLTAAQLEQLQKQAYDEGYEEGRRAGQEFGHREGLEGARRDIAEKLSQLDGLMQALAEPFQELDDQVEAEVVTLVISMVKQLVRREVKSDPGQIIGVVREALGVLPVAARGIRVMLHPEDAVLVREVYAMGEAEQQWQVVEDPVIQRGGCRVQSENSTVDATLESRINALIAPLLAGERNRDSDEDSEDEKLPGSD